MAAVAGRSARSLTSACRRAVPSAFGSHWRKPAAAASSGFKRTAKASAISDIETCLRLLREAGFDSPAPRAEKIESRASIKSAHQLIELLTEGTVRLSAVIRSQPPDKAAALITAVDRAIERYRDGDVFKIPAVAVLAVGVKEQPSRHFRAAGDRAASIG